jgi:hypothetical protein
MLRQVRAPCSHGKRAAERRGTVMALIPGLIKCLPAMSPTCGNLVSKVSISNRALSRIVFLTFSSLR